MSHQGHQTDDRSGGFDSLSAWILLLVVIVLIGLLFGAALLVKELILSIW